MVVEDIECLPPSVIYPTGESSGEAITSTKIGLQIESFRDLASDDIDYDIGDVSGRQHDLTVCVIPAYLQE